MALRDTTCCGLKEYSGLLADEKESLASICEEMFDQGKQMAFILFTDPLSAGDKGIRLAKLIRDELVGTLVETEPRLNPNSRHMLQAWLFAPDLAVLSRWYEAYKVVMKARVAENGLMAGDKVVSVPRGDPYGERFQPGTKFVILRVHADLRVVDVMNESNKQVWSGFSCTYFSKPSKTLAALQSMFTGSSN